MNACSLFPQTLGCSSCELSWHKSSRSIPKWLLPLVRSSTRRSPGCWRILKNEHFARIPIPTPVYFFLNTPSLGFPFHSIPLVCSSKSLGLLSKPNSLPHPHLTLHTAWNCTSACLSNTQFHLSKIHNRLQLKATISSTSFPLCL